MRKSFLVLLSVFVFTAIQALPDPPVDLFLLNQAQVNAASATTVVTGSLIITGSDITDLSPLSSLTTVGFQVQVIGCAILTNLDGLSSLTEVGDELVIVSNPSLTSFCGLYPLISGPGAPATYNISGNASNPSEQDIFDGGACATPSVPLSNWAIYLGILLMAMLMFVTYRRRLVA